MYNVETFELSDARDERWHAVAPASSWPDPRHAPALHLLSQNGTTIGRAATLINPAFKEGLIGWYECTDDPDASRILLARALQNLKDRGCTDVLGPINGTTWHAYRFGNGLPQFFMDIQNKPWYPTQFENAGFESVERYYSRLVPLTSLVSNTPPISLRTLDRTLFNEEIENIYRMSVLGFAGNPYYSDISLQDFRGLYMGIDRVLDPELVLFAEVDGIPAGFLFSVPNGMDRAHKTVIFKTTCVLPEYRGQRIFRALVSGAASAALEKGYDSAILALYRENNASALPRIGGHIVRQYHLYRRSL